MAGVFISYRRTPSSAWARSLADRLRSHFGRHQVFLDVDDIDPGADFPDEIAQRIRRTVLVVVIDPGWIQVADGVPARESTVWAHREAAAALAEGVALIPVLVDRAKMPSREQLPADLRELADRNAIEISPVDFEGSVRQLIVALEQRGVTRSLPRRVGIKGGVALVVLLVVISVLVAVRAVDFFKERSLRSEATGPVVAYDGVQWETFEVSNERYALCVQANACGRPGPSRPGAPYDDPTRATLPVVSVTAVDAAAFCEWIGRRLPTAQEWRVAATHGGRSVWPWGDSPPTPEKVVADLRLDKGLFSDLTAEEQRLVNGLVSRENVTVEDVEAVAPEYTQAEDIEQLVEDFPRMEPPERRDALVRLFAQGLSPTDVQEVTHARDGRTPEGIYALVGNAAEWSATPLDPPEAGGTNQTWDEASSVMLRVDGGAFTDIVDDLMSQGFGMNSDDRRDDVGFRCVDDD